MSSNEIRYCIDNKERLFEELEKILESLPQEASEKFEKFAEDGNIEGIYNIISNASPNNSVTLSSLKLLLFLNDFDLKDILFSNEEYKNLLKEIVDIYGDRLPEIMNTNSNSFNISDLDFLLSFDDLKYSEVYKSVLENKLTSSKSLEDTIETLKSSNTSIANEVVSKELITNFLENYNAPMIGSKAIEFLKTLPSSILQDGAIAKSIIRKIDYRMGGDEEILDYIPPSAYDSKFVNEILDKSEYNFDEVFERIPTELKTRKIWERACDRKDTTNHRFIKYLNQLPNNNIDPNISQEEYASWVENLITRKMTENAGNSLYILSQLDDSKKTTTLCQKIAESVPFEKDNWGFNNFLKYIPENCRTQQLYETLVSKSPSFFRDIPLQSFVPNISQEEYDTWFENLISNSITNTEYVNTLYSLIPREKINERIWNEFLDKCPSINDGKFASLSTVPFENLTPQMVERAMKDIDITELYYVPCIDKKMDDYYGAKKEEYEKWQASFTKEQKQVYRNWYEQVWIKFVDKTKTPGSLYTYVPKEAITTAMNKACIDINYARSIERMPVPETPEQIREYQQLLIYAVSKIPNHDYNGFQFDIDIFESIPKEYISDEVVRAAIEKSVVFLTYADPTAENFRELVDIAYNYKLKRIGRTELTEKEHELIQKFAINNAELFKTLNLEILDPKIISAIGESSLEKITRYADVQYSIIQTSKNEPKLKTFGFALENLKMDNIFIEPLIEKLSISINECFDSTFFDLVSQRLDRKDITFTDYEKAIISYLALNSQEARKITSYDEILTFVERKNKELENTINNKESTLLEVKNAYLERLVGLNYETVVNLVTMYGNDPEQLLQNYKNVSPKSFKELSEKESLEIIIKLKSLIETQDIDAIRSEYQKSISMERKEESYLRYQKSTILETSLRRAYGRDMVDSLSKNVGLLQEKELEFEGEKYLVRNVDGEFSRMVSLLGAYRKSSATEGDMYDRWNTNQMAANHALCYSLINESNPGTAMIDNKKGIIISINGFSPESIVAAAPYDLSSNNKFNTIFLLRQQRFFSAQNMPNQTRGRYSEYDIEIQDVLSKSDKYQKIQPASIICFEEVDEDSIRAAIELSKKLGHQVPIELIDRRKLAKNEMAHITDALNKFKNDENINTALVEEIITRFNNVRNANRSSNLADELLGEQNDNKDAPFNREHLNQMLKECLASVEQRIQSGQVKEGLDALESIKVAISNDRQKSFLMPTMYEKQIWTGIDTDIDYTIDELQRTYGEQIIKPLEEIKILKTLSQMQEQESSSISFDVSQKGSFFLPEQISAEHIIQAIDTSKIQKEINEIHSKGFYQKNKVYDEEHIARVILYSDVISKMEGFDDKTRELLTEVAKYYSCGRQLDVYEKHGEYSAKLAGKALADKYSAEDLDMIQATIEFQNFSYHSRDLSVIEQKRKEKFDELCSKYGISEEKAATVSKMANCINDSVKLDETRFVDKVNYHQGFRISNLKSESAKKMVEFSYSIQEQLAQQELDRLANILKIDFEAEHEQIMEDFFTEFLLGGEKRKVKNDKITKSPIVRLEYLKTKYPEIAKMNIDELSKKKQTEVAIEKNESLEISQLESQRRDLRRKQFEARATELGLQTNSVLTLDKLFEQEVLELGVNQEMSEETSIGKL